MQNRNGRQSLRPRNRPCPSCPYRRDVPSGIWDEAEYAKLPGYDGDIPAQAAAGAFGVFLCHQKDGHLCAGWAACHDMGNSLAVRMNAGDIDLDAVLGYVSPVPLFDSGAEAAEHGTRDLPSPGDAARQKISTLLRLRERRS